MKILSVVLLFASAAVVTIRPSYGQDSIPLVERQLPSGELAGWKSFHEDPATKTADVWTLTEDGILVCKGIPKGYIYTEKDYGDFELTLEFRRPADKEPGKGGILIRTTGPDRIWPKSLEAQINAPDAGDFWGLVGFTFDGPAERLKTLEHPDFGKLTNLKKTQDAEKKPGEWNTYKVIADGPTVTLFINGKQVNQAKNCETTPGKIVLTSEGDEIHFRNIRLKTGK